MDFNSLLQVDFKHFISASNSLTLCFINALILGLVVFCSFKNFSGTSILIAFVPSKEGTAALINEELHSFSYHFIEISNLEGLDRWEDIYYSC